MDNWKVRIQYLDRYEVKMDKTEKQAKKIFNDLKAKRYEKQVVWCELVYLPNDEYVDEVIVDSFENRVINVLGYDMVV